MKIVIIIVFIATAYVTLLWHSGVERGLTGTQRRIAGGAAMLGWIFTFALAAMA